MKMRKISLYVLAFGTFGLGMAEFGMMSVLSQAAASLNVSIDEAGHFISAYALGVCAGALGLVFVADRHSLKTLLLALTLLMCFGNTLAIVAPDYHFMVLARFISGLPHGCYFGVAGIVAKRLAAKKKQVQAVAIMISGMTVANLAGIPVAAYISHIASWHMLFALVVSWDLWSVYAIYKWVPNLQPLDAPDIRGQFAFLKKPLPWLMLATIMLGNGGLFCWYSYINPIMLDEAGFTSADMAGIMAVAGIGMVAGNYISGRLSLFLSPVRLTAAMLVLMLIATIGIIFGSAGGITAVALMFAGAFGLFGISGPEQYLMMESARGGELLGASSAQAAFNLGNALGAFCGGLPIAAGYTVQYSAVPGVFSALGGLVTVFLFSRLYGKNTAQ